MPADMEPVDPHGAAHEPRPEESERIERARLKWRSRRGMRELDAVLAAFIDSRFDVLDAADRARLSVILDLPDPELHAYLVGGLVAEDPAFDDLFRRIRAAFVPPA